MTTDLHIGRRPELISLWRYRAISKGGNRKDLRGRYVCRFDDGSELVLQKVGDHRHNDGSLNVLGAHIVVVDGAATKRRFTVSTANPVSECTRSRSRRSKSEIFHVVLTEGDAHRTVVLEYLSTVAWDLRDASSGDVMGRLRSGAPSVTIRTEFFKPEKGRYLHPTDFEAAKLLGVPDDFECYGSKLQFGNAVPIPLGRKIAESIYLYIHGAE